MRLTADSFCYLPPNAWRLLTAVELSMKNHEYASLPLLSQISKLNPRVIPPSLAILLKNKLVHHRGGGVGVEGYKLTALGLDFLALHALEKRKLVKSVGRRIGVGKEADVHVCQGEDGKILILKLHRLGRVSFRSVKNNRDYMQNRMHSSWQYLSHLAAKREYSYLKALHEYNFPVPKAIDMNRHAVLMEYVDALPLSQVKTLANPARVLQRLVDLCVSLARCGLIHGDFNEFNLLVDDKENITLIDLPQMVSVYHPNAAMYFERDVECIRSLFRKKFQYIVERLPTLAEVLEGATSKRMDLNANEDAADVVPITEGLEAQENLLLDEAIAASRAEGVQSGDVASETTDSSRGSDVGDDGIEDAVESDDSFSEQDDNSGSAESHGTSCSDGDETADEGESPYNKPMLSKSEQVAMAQCWKPTARRHTRDEVRKRVRAKQKGNKGKGNFGNNKSRERIRAKQMCKVDS